MAREKSKIEIQPTATHRVQRCTFCFENIQSIRWRRLTKTVGNFTRTTKDDADVALPGTGSILRCQILQWPYVGGGRRESMCGLFAAGGKLLKRVSPYPLLNDVVTFLWNSFV